MMGRSKAFPQGGLYVMRSEAIYLLCVCHKIGVNGVGPHKHNDWLSFELCVGEYPVIIDPGTYCYTGNMEMRRLFRSTAYHNSAVVDGQEQIPIHNSMFALVNPAGDIHVLEWSSDDTSDKLLAEHTGYERLDRPVIHRRSFYLDKVNQIIVIEDLFHGRGKHEVEFFFHLDTAVDCRAENNKAAFSASDKPLAEMTIDPPDAALCVSSGWVSRAYNQKEAAQIVSWQATIDAANPQPIKHTFQIEQESKQ